MKREHREIKEKEIEHEHKERTRYGKKHEKKMQKKYKIPKIYHERKPKQNINEGKTDKGNKNNARKNTQLKKQTNKHKTVKKINTKSFKKTYEPANIIRDTTRPLGYEYSFRRTIWNMQQNLGSKKEHWATFAGEILYGNNSDSCAGFKQMDPRRGCFRKNEDAVVPSPLNVARVRCKDVCMC